MLNRNYEIKLDLQFRCNNQTMQFMQFDKNTSDFFISIERGCEEIDLSNTIITLAVIKPDNTTDAMFIDIVENKLYSNLKPSMKDLVGTYQARAMLVSNDETVTTDVITYTVNEDKILSQLNFNVIKEERYHLLTDMLNRLSTIEVNENNRVEAEKLREQKIIELTTEANAKIEEVDNKISEANTFIDEKNNEVNNFLEEASTNIEEAIKSIPPKSELIGPEGERGESAYEIAVKHGFNGTEEEWLKSFRNNLIVDYVHEGNPVIEISDIDYETATFITSKPHGLKHNDPVIAVYKKGLFEDFDTRVMPKEFAPYRGVFTARDITETSFRLFRKTSSNSALGWGALIKNSKIDISKFHFEKCDIGLLEIQLGKQYKNLQVRTAGAITNLSRMQFDQPILAYDDYGNFRPMCNNSYGYGDLIVDISIDESAANIIAISSLNYMSDTTRYYKPNTYTDGVRNAFSTKLKYVDKIIFDFAFFDYAGGSYLPNGTRIKIYDMDGV